MSLFASLYTGASGMLAFEKATSIISTNVANINTTGFKRSEATFRDIVTTASRRSPYQTGAVQAERLLRANEAGQYQQTSNNTDAAIVGNGFFAVRPDTDVNSEMLYTRNGRFEPDANGIVRNANGFVLYAWQLDSTGTTPGGTIANLVPIDVSTVSNTALPTTQLSVSANLDAAQRPYDPHLLSPPQQLPVDAESSHFSRSFDIYDAQGTQRQITMEFRKIVGPMAHFTSNINTPFSIDDVLVDNPSGLTPGIVNGDTLSISDGTNTLDVNFVTGPADTSLNEATTMSDLLEVINNYVPMGATEPAFTADLNSNNGQLLVRARDPSVSLDISASAASALGLNGFNFVQDPDMAPDYIYEPDADITINDTANPNQLEFPAFANTTNPFNWWETTIRIPDPAAPSGSTLTELRKGYINFNEDGTLNAQLDADGRAFIDLASTPVDFDSSATGEEISFNIDITRFSQLAGEYSVINASQDGAPIGVPTGYEIARDGTFSARFSNGQTSDIYRIPVVLFPNAGGLEDESGTVFTESTVSGAPVLTEAGLNGGGVIEASTLEGSNVDIGDEFGHMIVNQRAYGLNGQIIRTVDEMTSNLVQLSR